jgi:hypothetical protein
MYASQGTRSLLVLGEETTYRLLGSCVSGGLAGDGGVPHAFLAGPLGGDALLAAGQDVDGFLDIVEQGLGVGLPGLLATLGVNDLVAHVGPGCDVLVQGISGHQD